MRRFYTIARWTSRAILGLSAIVLAAIPFVIVFDIASRALFQRPTVWSLEIAILLFQAVVFLPLGSLLLEGRHFKVTLLSNRFPEGSKTLSLVGLAAVALFASVMTFEGFSYTYHAWNQGQSSPTLLAIPLWISYVFIPSGGALLLLCAFAKVVFVCHGEEALYNEFHIHED